MFARETALLALRGLLFASASFAQQTAIRDQILGAWTLVSVEGVRQDGSKAEPFSSTPGLGRRCRQAARQSRKYAALSEELFRVDHWLPRVSAAGAHR